ncbi:MAG: hypothetical protein C5S41_08840 [Candidatus Methanomarinus sp.]|nr:MAG: hypothetical protein C5S41_08840 [ANME-2 cluster archaeon]KAF5425204.1 hypothetical protein C5S42_11300 [ANME-2 cluster archaeon]
MEIEDKISGKVWSIGLSASMNIAEKMKELKKQGEDIIDLSWNEPYFNTPHYKHVGIPAGKR